MANLTNTRLKNVELLMRSNSNQIGFIPMSRIEEQEKRGFVFHQYDNGTWMGYLIVGNIKAGATTHIWQECIDKTAMGYGSGTRLFFQLLERCKDNYVHQIVLRCREDLESNLFWKAMGFEFVKAINENNARRKLINIYRLEISKTLFSNIIQIDKQIGSIITNL